MYGGGTRSRDIFWPKHRRRFLVLVGVRMVKESDRKFDAKNPARSFVDGGLRNFSRLDQLQQLPVVKIADHIHVHAGQQRLAGCGRTIIGDSMRHQFTYRRPIAYHEALECPFFFQDLFQSKRICRCRDSVQRIESAHEGGGASFFRRVKWRQVILPQRVLGDLGGGVFAARLRCSIADVVLHASHDTVGRIQVFALIAANISSRHWCAEKWIFACSLGNPTPPRVSRNVHHRRKRPPHSACRSLLRGHSRRLFHQRRIPRGGQPQWNWKCRSVTVNYIQAENQRDMQAQLLYRNPLQRIGLLRPGHVEQRTDLPLTNHIRIVRTAGRWPGGLPRRILNELPDFFCQRHLLQKLAYFLFSRRRVQGGLRITPLLLFRSRLGQSRRRERSQDRQSENDRKRTSDSSVSVNEFFPNCAIFHGLLKCTFSLQSL